MAWRLITHADNSNRTELLSLVLHVVNGHDAVFPCYFSELRAVFQLNLASNV